MVSEASKTAFIASLATGLGAGLIPYLSGPNRLWAPGIAAVLNVPSFFLPFLPTYVPTWPLRIKALAIAAGGVVGSDTVHELISYLFKNPTYAYIGAAVGAIAGSTIGSRCGEPVRLRHAIAGAAIGFFTAPISMPHIAGIANFPIAID